MLGLRSKNGDGRAPTSAPHLLCTTCRGKKWCWLDCQILAVYVEKHMCLGIQSTCQNCRAWGCTMYTLCRWSNLQPSQHGPRNRGCLIQYKDWQIKMVGLHGHWGWKLRQRLGTHTGTCFMVRGVSVEGVVHT